MFEALSDKLTGALRDLSGRGRISESNVREAMEEVRTALLEADVHVDVVSRFCEGILEEAVGKTVTSSLKPGEEMVGIVHRRLVELMGGEDASLMLVEPAPTIIMACGLQGSGKTTTCGKLAMHLRGEGKSVCLVAADLQRPAAVEQLEVIAADADGGSGRVSFYGEPDRCAEYGTATGVAVDVCKRGIKHAQSLSADVVILDTAGRLHIDEDLMKELRGVQRTAQPHQIVLVIDAMVGQDAVTAARAFHDQLAVDGVILAKFDSDARGGAALSVKAVTGVPLLFVGTGERVDALERFHPERAAGRILGMGDVVSLVEKAQAEVSEEDAEKLAEKMASGSMTIGDFIKQLRMIRRMGPMKKVLGLLPGVGSALKGVDVDDRQFDRIEAIANSMTPGERDDATILGKSRLKRIAAGSGTNQGDVGRFVKQFEMMRKATKQMAGTGMRDKLAAMKDLDPNDPSSLPGLDALGSGRGSTRTDSHKKRFKKRKKR